MRKFDVFLVLAAIGVATTFTMNDALAQSSLGIGRGEQAIPTGGFFEGFFNWVRSQQADFHQDIRKILVDMRKDGTHFWSLILLCFAYGVFHAVGPGHGKVVISSYMLANEVAARRGIFLSFTASIMQGVTAVLAITVFMFALRGTGIKTGELTFGLEVASYVGVMAVGLWLLWRKIFRKSHTHSHAHDHAHSGHGDTCDHCGHSHAPDPKTLEGTFGLREAWSAILAVGLRPCTGALIVLVFCFANGLYLAGVASTFAMSLGTGLAVSLLAILAVVAKNTAMRVAGAQERTAFIHSAIEIAGAGFIFLIGAVLLTAALSS